MQVKQIYIVGIIMLFVVLYYWKYHHKRVSIQEKKNEEYFLVISQNDQILQPMNSQNDQILQPMNNVKYECGRYSRQDLHDITEMDIVR